MVSALILRSLRPKAIPVVACLVAPLVATPASALAPLRASGVQAQGSAAAPPGSRPQAHPSGAKDQSRLATAVARLGDYAGAEPQLSSINQLGDLQPSDWAYQALAALVERYGCVAGYANGSFSGSRALSRFEAAALLNGCLERVSESSDALQKLLKEFGPELAILTGRIDGLGGRVGALGASQFSATTTLSGLAVFVLGGNAFPHTGPLITSVRTLPNGSSFNYNLELALNTSFTGKDLFRTVLRAGNFGASAFGGQPAFLGLSELESAFESDAGANIVAIDKLFYQWPLGKGFTATVGARVGQDDMLAVWPSAYPADTILNVMTVNGAPAAYSKNLGPGFGLMWKGKHFSVSSNYVASNGASGEPGVGGLGSQGAGGSRTLQVAYVADQWGLAVIYSFLQPFSQGVPGITPLANRAMDLNGAASTNAYGLSGYWQPLRPGWLPSVSGGIGLNTTSYSTAPPSGSPTAAESQDWLLEQSQSWLLALQWKDAFAQGNALGLAVGSPVRATGLRGDVTPHDGTTVMEAWYKVQLTDQISLTPALFYITRPLGQLTPSGHTLSQLGALIKTSFRF